MKLSSVRIELIKERGVTYDAPTRLTCGHEVAILVQDIIGNADREHMISISLDSKNRPLHIHTVSIGSLNAAVVHPREVFKAAILANAACIALAHNHPSGDPSPSREDIEITKRIKECAELLGIQLLDHVIVGDLGTYYSLADNNQI
jgi:DNA repair protein RadC